jgi:two-component system chemotaxis response regulator CheY
MSDKLRWPILLVDDYPEMVKTLHRMLSHFGFIFIEHAQDGISALAKLRSGPYGLVISDIAMTPMGGIQLLREIRGDANLRKLPFIIVTGAADRQRILDAKSAGANEFIVKPFATATLKKKLIDVLGPF